MNILVVTFGLDGMSEGEYAEFAEESAPAFGELPGLVSKTWISDPQTNTYGGVYLWRDRESMEEYRRSEIYGLLVDSPSFVGVTSHGFDVLEAPSRITAAIG